MFNKKECKRCGKKLKNSYDFCPFCGSSTSKKQKDLGMLGDTDITEDNLTQNLFSGFGGGILNKMLNQTIKMLEKEMQKEIKTEQKQHRGHMELFINGQKVDLSKGRQKQTKKQVNQKIKSIHFNEKNQKKFISLKQTEPKTELKRLDNTILYQIQLPKVESLKDISIVKLENSIEIKAISKTKSYYKTIPINLELTNYEFNNEKLVLEFVE
ncbi:MAG: zinc ribbon domain-containing protein [Candidatus Pacearchaeota archaeon]|nr:zinc ribbon domain-containing protein [Candidatus Pacearchaeota archaeon]